MYICIYKKSIMDFRCVWSVPHLAKKQIKKSEEGKHGWTDRVTD